MAIHAHSTPASVDHPRLLRGDGAGACRVLTTADVLAPAGEAPDFSPVAVMDRAGAFTAGSAARQASCPPVSDPRSAVEILDEISREIDRHETEAAPLPPPAPLPSLTKAFSRRRAIFGGASAVALAGCAPTSEALTPADRARQGDVIDTGPTKLTASDARLVDLGTTLDVVAARMVFVLRDEDVDGEIARASVDRVDNLVRELAFMPAHSLNGVATKVRALADVTMRWNDWDGSRQLVKSIAADVVRFQAEGGFA